MAINSLVVTYIIKKYLLFIAILIRTFLHTFLLPFIRTPVFTYPVCSRATRLESQVEDCFFLLIQFFFRLSCFISHSSYTSKRLGSLSCVGANGNIAVPVEMQMTSLTIHLCDRKSCRSILALCLTSILFAGAALGRDAIAQLRPRSFPRAMMKDSHIEREWEPQPTHTCDFESYF